MRAVKAIQFRYVASDELASLFEGFRLMCNDAIRIALKEKPRSRTESVVPFLQQGGDRNVVPSRNIMAPWFVRLGHPGKAVKGNLEGRRRRVIPRADGWRLASVMGRRVDRTLLLSDRLEL